MCDRNHGEPVLAVKLHCNTADSEIRLSILASSFSFLFSFVFFLFLYFQELPSLTFIWSRKLHSSVQEEIKLVLKKKRKKNLGSQNITSASKAFWLMSTQLGRGSQTAEIHQCWLSGLFSKVTNSKSSCWIAFSFISNFWLCNSPDSVH